MLLVVVIVVGFLLMPLGFALLVLGEVPFIGGKRIPALRGRLIGGVLIAYLPLALLTRVAIGWLFASDVEGPIIAALLFGLCCVVIFLILFPVLAPKRAPRPLRLAPPQSKPNPFADVAPPPPVEPPAPEKSATRKAGSDKNPFDFV